MLHVHINAPQNCLSDPSGIIPNDLYIPWLLSRLSGRFFFFPFHFRIADTACVRSDLSGLKYCYAGDATQTSPSSLPLSKDTLISTYLQLTGYFFSINLFLSISIKYCLNFTVSYIYVKSEGKKKRKVMRIWSRKLLFTFFGVLTAYWLIVCTYVRFLWSTVCSEVADKMLTAVTLFKKL